MDGHGLDGPTWKELALDRQKSLERLNEHLGRCRQRALELERSVSHLEAKIENLHQIIRHLVVTFVHDRDE